MRTCTAAPTAPSRIALALLVAALLFAAPSAFGSSISDLYNTGTGTPGALDSHWTVNGGPAYVTKTGVFPFPYWFSDTATSDWISPHANYDPNKSDPADRTYEFTTTFTLPNTFTGAWISFLAATDNALVDVRLNGTTVGFPTTPTFLPGDSFTTNIIPQGSGFSLGGLSPLSISSGFRPGENNLAFFVGNSATGRENIGNPTGLNVAFESSVTQNPEPLTLVLLGSGLVGMGLLRRKCRG